MCQWQRCRCTREESASRRYLYKLQCEDAAKLENSMLQWEVNGEYEQKIEDKGEYTCTSIAYE